MWRRAGAVAGLAATAALLSGCGNGGLTLARQACAHVDRSINDWNAAEHAPNAHLQQQLATRAYTELRAALPLAAQATSSDGQWNALMTTISESARVGEASLVHALELQCAVAASNQPAFPNPSAPSTSTPSGGPATTTTSTAPVQNGY